MAKPSNPQTLKPIALSVGPQGRSQRGRLEDDPSTSLRYARGERRGAGLVLPALKKSIIIGIAAIAGFFRKPLGARK